jgi:hypothetical protein
MNMHMCTLYSMLCCVSSSVTSDNVSEGFCATRRYLAGAGEHALQYPSGSLSSSCHMRLLPAIKQLPDLLPTPPSSVAIIRPVLQAHVEA